MKALIDKFYAENYDLLINASRKRISQKGSIIDPESVVSSSYLYLISRKDNITEQEIPRMAMGFICMELSLYNSATNRQHFRYDDLDPLIVETYNQIDSEILKIDIEDFRNRLDRYERIVFDCYYEKGLTKKKELAEHFKIDETSAWFLIKNLKDKYIEYAKTEKRI